MFVAAALIGIGEHLVGLANLLERRLRLLVVGIDIRVVLAGQLAEGPLHRIGIGAPLQAQYLEVIAISTGSHRGVGGERSMAPPLSQLKRPSWLPAQGGRPNDGRQAQASPGGSRGEQRPLAALVGGPPRKPKGSALASSQHREPPWPLSPTLPSEPPGR